MPTPDAQDWADVASAAASTAVAAAGVLENATEALNLALAGVSGGGASGAASGAWYVDTAAGSDTNNGSSESMFATLEKAITRVTPGDTIWLRSGAEIKFADNLAYSAINNPGVYRIPTGTKIRSLGSTAVFNAFDPINGLFTLDTGTVYHVDFVSKFGGDGALGGAGKLFPNAIYQRANDTDYRKVRWYYPDDFAGDDDAALVFVGANVGTGYFKDQSGHGGSVTAGWRKGGTIRMYVNLGADPSTYSWLVAQRQVPVFDAHHMIENVRFFGGLHADGLTCYGSLLENVEIAHPSNHAGLLTGTSTVNVTIRDGRPGAVGNAIHHSGDAPTWAKGVDAKHRGLRVSNWHGDVFGKSGTGTSVGSVRIEDSQFQNIGGLGTMGTASRGVSLHRCNVFGYGTLGAFGSNALLVDCNLTAKFALDDYGVKIGTQTVLTSPLAGFVLTMNGGSVANYAGGTISPAGGGIVFNRVQFAQAAFQQMVTHGGDHQGVFFNNCAGQLLQVAGSKGAAFTSGGTANRVVTINNSHFGGFASPRTLNNVTVDEHSVFGGDAGLALTDNPQNPVVPTPASSWRSLGDRYMNGGGYWGRDVTWATSRGIYYHSLQGSGAALYYGGDTNQFVAPAGFVPRGCSGGKDRDTLKLYYYGLAGKVYKVTSASGTFAAVNMGSLTNNFVGHLLDGNNLFLLGDDGSITKIDTLTDTVTQILSDGALVSYKLRGGVVVSAGGNLLVYGGNDDEVFGGVLYSTNGGTTWAVNATSSIPKTFRCGALVNGVIALGGMDGAFWTASAVNGTFTSRALRGIQSYNIVSMAADPTLNQLGLVLRGTSGGTYSTRRAPLRNALGFIDASSSDASTWKAKARSAPFCGEALFYNAEESATTGQSFVLVGQTGRIAAVSELLDGSDWIVSSPAATDVGIPLVGATVMDAPTLAPLALSNYNVTEATPEGVEVAAINGKTAGSVLSLLNNDGNRFTLVGNTITTGATAIDFEAGGTRSITIRETLTGAVNTPRDTVITLTVNNVFEAAALSALSLSSTTAQVGTVKNILIVGTTAGSTLTGSVPAGMTLSSAGRTISGTPTTAGTYNFTLTETLADSPNSPKVTSLTITVAAAPVLAALSLSASTVSENAVAGMTVGNIVGITAGSTVTLLNHDNNRFAISGTTLVVGTTNISYEDSPTRSITVRETLAGAANTPRDTVLTINVTNVFEAATLGTLTLSPTTATAGAAATINIVGATAGSTITGSVPTGMTLNSSARTITGTPSAGSYDITLTETLTDSPNSPKANIVTLTVTASGAMTVSGTPSNAFWDSFYTQTLTVSGGTAPYTVSGLPPGLTATESGGVITITGTPK